MPAGDSSLPGNVFVVRERKQLLNLSWLVALFTVFVGLATPWYFRMIDVDLSFFTWGVFAYAAVHVALSALTDRVTSRRGLLLSITAMQSLGILFLAVLWHLAGGLNNPAFLVVFAMPVVMSGLTLLPFQPISAAALSVAAVGSVAVFGSATLRWYLLQVGLPLAPIFSRMPTATTSDTALFPGFVSTPAFASVQLGVFSVMIFGLALVTEVVRHLLTNAEEQAGSSDQALRSAGDLFAKVLQAAPTPSVLVHVATGQVVEGSESFFQQMLLERSDLNRRRFLELVQFADTEAIEELLREGGEAAFAAYRVGEERRVGRVACYRIDHAGSRYAYVSVEDTTSLYYLDAAFDTLDEPQLVVGSGARLCYFNRAAGAVFGDLFVNLDVREILNVEGLSEAWWDQPLDSVRRVRFGGRSYRARCIPVRLPDGDERVTVISFERADS